MRPDVVEPLMPRFFGFVAADVLKHAEKPINMGRGLLLLHKFFVMNWMTVGQKDTTNFPPVALVLLHMRKRQLRPLNN